MQPGADQQERRRRAEQPDPDGRLGRVPGAGEYQQGERHERQAAELHHGAAVDERRALPAELGSVRVGTKADERPERREDQW